MTTRDRLSLTDMIHELCEPVTHREHYTIARTNHDGFTTWFGRDHITTHPPLLDQLAWAPGTGDTDQRSSAGFASRPAASLEALDTLTTIDLAAARWVKDLGEDDPGDTKACILRLHGLTPSTTDTQRQEITRDVRRWWRWARIQTGWDSPAWRPNNTCPLCGVRGALRVNLTDHAGFCVECRETWEPDQIGLLADHIRAENADSDTPQYARRGA